MTEADYQSDRLAAIREARVGEMVRVLMPSTFVPWSAAMLPTWDIFVVTQDMKS